MASKRSPGTKKPTKTDDIKLIPGIGPAIERRLLHAGILTFADLAALSPDELAASVHGLSVKRINYRKWIDQARKLALAQKQTRPGRNEASALNRQRYVAFTVELLLDQKNAVRRTHVKHIQDGDEEIWASWQEARLFDFFVKHARICRQSPESIPPPVKTSPADYGSAKLHAGKKEEAIGVQSAEKPGSPRTPDTASDELQADFHLDVEGMQLREILPGTGNGNLPGKHLRVQLNFRLSGSECKDVADQQSSCFIQLLACEVTMGLVLILATVEDQLQPGRLSYTVTLTFPVPRMGHYKLMGLVLLPEEDKAGMALGPMLNVIL